MFAERLLSSIPALTPHERSVLTATCLASLGSYYTMTVPGFAMPQIQRGLAISEDEVGTLFALLRFGTLFSLALGVLADRVGRRRIFILSVAGIALFNVASAFAPSGIALAWLQFGGRVFLGAQVLLAVVVVTEELSPDNRGFGLGVLAAVGGLGGALTLLMYVFVDVLPYGWRSLFVVGGFGLLWVPWLWRSLKETTRFAEHQDRSGAAGSVWQPLVEMMGPQRRRVLALVGVMLPVTIIMEPGLVFVSKHLQDGLGYSPAQVGLFIAVGGAATPLANVLAGGLSDRFGRRPTTILASLLLSLAVAIFYSAEGIVLQVIGLALIFVGVGFLLVLHGAMATELFPTRLRSTAAGSREAVTTVGASLGLWAVGALYAVTGSHAMSTLWLLVLTPIAPLVVLFWVPETARRELEEIASDEAG